MIFVHDKVLAPRPSRKITLEVGEVTEVSGDYLTVKFPDKRRYSKITIHNEDCTKVADDYENADN